MYISLNGYIYSKLMNMKKLKLFTLVILLGAGIISCNKNKPVQPTQTLKYSGIATTYKSEIRWRENGSEYHFMARDTLNFELTVIIKGETIQFLSTNDSIVASGTFDVKDSIAKNNTYTAFLSPSKMELIKKKYRLEQDSLIYTYDHNHYYSINSYNVKFKGIKQ